MNAFYSDVSDTLRRFGVEVNISSLNGVMVLSGDIANLSTAKDALIDDVTLRLSRIFEAGSCDTEEFGQLLFYDRQLIGNLINSQANQMIIAKDFDLDDILRDFVEKIIDSLPSGVIICPIKTREGSVILHSREANELYHATNEVWKKLGIVSDVLLVGTQEEIKFRAGVTDDIAKLLPSSGAYAVIKQKSANESAT